MQEVKLEEGQSRCRTLHLLLENTFLSLVLGCVWGGGGGGGGRRELFFALFCFGV